MSHAAISETISRTAISRARELLGGLRLRIAIAGSSGLIGNALKLLLHECGQTAVPLIRMPHTTPRALPNQGKTIEWDPSSGALEPAALENIDAVINLSGASIATRWTARKKIELRESRLGTTALLAEAIARTREKGAARGPTVFLSASAIGIYGDRGEELLTETSSPGQGFLPDLAREWEAATAAAALSSCRVVNMRFGVALSPHGGALATMLPFYRIGLGGPFGSGRQWFSWIMLDDLLLAMLWLIIREALCGPVNFVAPNPVRNSDFSAALARAMHRPNFARVPAAALRLVFGEMANGALLASTRVRSELLAAHGFSFLYPELNSALKEALR